jgi:hypothetical protein
MKILRRSILILGFSLVFGISAMGGSTQGPSVICVPGETNSPPSCEPPPPQEINSGSSFSFTFGVDSASIAIAIGEWQAFIL